MSYFPGKSSSTLAIVLVSLLGLSCTKDAPTAPLPLPPPPSISGSWSGTIATTSTPLTFVVGLNQNQNAVTGRGTVATLSTNVRGEVHFPTVSLTFSFTGYQPFTFSGSFGSLSKITGVVNGSGFTNTGTTLVKN